MDDVLIADLPPALFAREAGKVPVFSLREACRFWPEHKEDFIWARLKTLAEKRLIHQRQQRGYGKTGAAMFGVDDLAAAAALMAIMDTGVHDAEVSAAASTALYAWHEALNPPPGTYPTPIAAALIGSLARGEFWTLRVNSYFAGTQRQLLAAVLPDEIQINTQAVLPPEYLPRTSISVCLPPLFDRFLSAFPRKVH